MYVLLFLGLFQKKSGTFELTAQMILQVEDAFNVKNNNIIFRGSNFQVTRNDLRTLKKNVWVNDEIMNCKMKMLTSRSKKDRLLPKVHAMSSFFYG